MQFQMTRAASTASIYHTVFGAFQDLPSSGQLCSSSSLDLVLPTVLIGVKVIRAVVPIWGPLVKASADQIKFANDQNGGLACRFWMKDRSVKVVSLGYGMFGSWLCCDLLPRAEVQLRCVDTDVTNINSNGVREDWRTAISLESSAKCELRSMIF